MAQLITRAQIDDATRDVHSTVLIAGASCAGKSTFIKQLKMSDAGDIASAIGLEALAEFTFYDAFEWGRAPLPWPRTRGIVLHYDIFRPITFYNQLDFSIDPVLEAFINRRSVTIATLWATPATMVERAKRRRKNLWRNIQWTGDTLTSARQRYWHARAEYREYRLKKRRRRQMRPWFRDSNRLTALYRQWLAYCDARQIDKHWLIDTTSDETQITRHVDGEPVL